MISEKQFQELKKVVEDTQQDVDTIKGILNDGEAFLNLENDMRWVKGLMKIIVIITATGASAMVGAAVKLIFFGG